MAFTDQISSFIKRLNYLCANVKKTLSAILLLIFFTVNTGFIVNLHYCMDRLDSMQIGASEAEKCGKCGMENNDVEGCCRSEVKLVKLQQDLTVTKALNTVFSLSPAISTFSIYLFSPQVNFISNTEQISHAPPLLSEQDTYLINRVIRL
jgi:hypothetical protein